MNETEVKVKEAIKVEEPKKEQTEKKQEENSDESFTVFLKRFLRNHWFTIFAIIYVISPIDIIPNAIFPVAGTVDDLAILLYTFFQEYKNYQKRKAGE